MDTAGADLDSPYMIQGDCFPSSEYNYTEELLKTLYVSFSGPRFLFKEGGSHISLTVGLDIHSAIWEIPCYTHTPTPPHTHVHGTTRTETHPKVRVLLNRHQAGRFPPLQCSLRDGQTHSLFSDPLHLSA